MNHRYLIIFFASLMLCKSSHAQQDEDAKTKAKNRTDIIAFHRLILSLKEYNDERSKIPALQKTIKVPVKVKALVDTNIDGDDESKDGMLTGYIRQERGSTIINVYEVTYDRKKKKIVSVKRSGDGEEAETPEKVPVEKKQANKNRKSKKEDTEDEDDDDTKTPKKEKDSDKDED